MPSLYKIVTGAISKAFLTGQPAKQNHCLA